MMRIAWVVFLLVAVGLGVLAGPPGYMFVLDASNSMNDPWTGGETKLAWAKEALIQTIQALPGDAAFGVVVFGHRFDPEPKAQSCADIELVLAFGIHAAAERAALIGKIRELTARGWTPLAEALKVAAAAAPAGTRIILLTDGEETCEGDPLAVAADLCRKGYGVDVVGIALEPPAQTSLRALAETCAGKFVLATEAAELPALLIELAAPPPIPACLARYAVDPKIVALLLEHLPYAPCTDPMWDVILRFLSANKPEKIIVGTGDDDALFGTPGTDLILGLSGTDTIYGFEGNDLLIGGGDEDLIQGGAGCDLILGGMGNDLLFGGPVDDEIHGEEGDDRLEGEAGADKLFGGPGCDILLGGPGCNLLDGGPGQNFLHEEGGCVPCPAPRPPTTPLAAPPGPKAKTVGEGKSLVLRATVHDPDGDPVKVTWHAANGHFSDPHAAETVYYAPMVQDCAGEFIPITVVAEDACGAKTQDTIVIHVLNVNHPPAVDAGPDLAVDEGQTVRLQGWACDPDGDPITVTWIVPSGRGALSDPNSLAPIYTAPLTNRCEGEVVEVVLLVRDACGAEARDTVRIFVRNVNRPPVADAGPDLSAWECGQVLLMGRASDPDGDPVKVLWTVTAGRLIGADTPTPVFIAPEVPGCEPIKVVATLRVVDACGLESTDQVVITVLNVNRPPTVKADP